jgi:hypothetical protein
MGTEALWVPAAIAAVGAGAQAYDTHRVAKRQEEEATTLMKNQQRKQKEADSRINDELGQLQGSGPDEERKAAFEAFMAQLRTNSGAAGGTADIGGASDRFKQDTEQSQADIANYGSNRADTLSRIIAPTRQRQGEGQSIGRMGSDIDGIARDARAREFLDQLRIQGIRTNPWVQGVGGAMQAAGGAMAGGALGGAKTIAGSAGKFAGMMDTPIARAGSFAMNA